MKTKTQPIDTYSPNYLEHACFKGLSKYQLQSAKDEIKRCEENGIVVHYGLIRSLALLLPKTPNI